ncbi:hypothetical protein F4803DRAFT_540305 [Xylaria telfairii]|nr:hypothetical protein F4803DRAFT_540305 [Xylaria telfairii]
MNTIMETGQDGSTRQGGQYPVYVGMWINWSRGRVLGSTLTISRRDADLLIAFTAFFVAFVTTRVWRIICYAFHRAYSTADPRDGIYHQRQTILRNSSSPEGGIQMLLQLLWANRHSEGWLRPLPAAVAATLCISTFTVAGGFSSRISSAVGNEVLIKPSNCGYTRGVPQTPSNPSYFSVSSNRATIISNAANYALQCYSDENLGLLDCNRFAAKKIPKRIYSQANCPFKDRLCQDQTNNLRIDSGYLDSHEVLGFNSPPNERILFRNVLHCAPLATAAFKSEGNVSLGRYTFYHYGNERYIDGANYIHSAPSVELQYAATAADDIIVSFTNLALSVYVSTVQNGTIADAYSDFWPINDMFRKDADLIMAFLSGNGVIFLELSDDPWYRLNTTPANFDFGYSHSTRLYIPQEPASPLGCTNQYQFCNSAYHNTSGCGPLTSLIDATTGAAPFFGSTYADFNNRSHKSDVEARFIYFTKMLFSGSAATVDQVLAQVGAAGLTTQKTLLGGIQGPIASNQWQRDVAHWWDISMAALQSQSLELAYLPDNSDVRATRFNYTAPEFQKLCSNQKIRTTEYASFSLFGLFFTLVAGLLMTLVSYLLEPLSGWLHRKKGHNKYPHLEWTINSTLQLQRLAHEEIGFGTWSEGTETIPITKPGQLLGSLDLSDPKHPVLCRPEDRNGTSLTADGSVEAPPTSMDDSSENSNIFLSSFNPTLNSQQGADAGIQGHSVNGELRIEGDWRETEPNIQSPSESLPSKQTAQLASPRHLQIARDATEFLIIDFWGSRGPG